MRTIPITSKKTHFYRLFSFSWGMLIYCLTKSLFCQIFIVMCQPSPSNLRKPTFIQLKWLAGLSTYCMTFVNKRGEADKILSNMDVCINCKRLNQGNKLLDWLCSVKTYCVTSCVCCTVMVHRYRFAYLTSNDVHICIDPSPSRTCHWSCTFGLGTPAVSFEGLKACE